MGIRYEHQQTDYYEKGIRIDAQSPTYNDIIPVLAASWSHNGKSFSLSYRLRKNNPDYSLLTNSIRYRSKYEYSQGNPLLKTQKTHRFRPVPLGIGSISQPISAIFSICIPI